MPPTVPNAPDQIHPPAPSRASEMAAPARSDRPFDGPAKWAAVVVLGLATAAVSAWALAHPRPALHLTRAPQPSAPLNSNDSPQSPDAATAPSTSDDTPRTNPTPTPIAAAATRLNVNSATQAQLELLPGVGPALAQRIIADREKNGRYTTVDQLDRVKGIGPKTIERLRPLVRVE